jgi:prevent-host-death family protein
MREIEVRELASRLSSVLREVEEGERVKIVEDGRPVAELAPSAPERGRATERAIAEGRATPATRPGPMSPATPRDTGRSASAFILAEREEER